MAHVNPVIKTLASADAAPGFRLASTAVPGYPHGVKTLFAALAATTLWIASSSATTIMVVPVFEPLSLHGTDGDEAISDTGEALQACVMSRPMALTGAFPEVLVDSIRSPHLVPTNNPNYRVQEANLLVLCNVGIGAELTDEEQLTVRLDVTQLVIPTEVDLTSRQILKLAIVALRKTLEEYQRPQTDAIEVNLVIDGAEGDKAGLRDLGVTFVVEGGSRED